MLEQKRLGNDGTGTARSEQASQGSDEMDEKNDQIAHHRILAGQEIPTNYGRNDNSPATGGPFDAASRHGRKSQKVLYFQRSEVIKEEFVRPNDIRDRLN
jgi:hypothetical protein